MKGILCIRIITVTVRGARSYGLAQKKGWLYARIQRACNGRMYSGRNVTGAFAAVLYIVGNCIAVGYMLPGGVFISRY